MLVAAALVPPTGLLVPGVAGRAAVLEEERAAALDAVRAALACEPDSVVVLRAGGDDADLVGGAFGSLRAAGVPDAAWHDGPSGAPAATDVRAGVALWLLARAGWSGPVALRAAAPDAPGVPAPAPAGAPGLVPGSPGRTVALLVGGGSVRRGPDAPLADDPRAAEVDEALVAWLASLADGHEPLPEPAPADVAHHGLDVVGPARALAAALPGSRVALPALRVSVPLGATYVVGAWLPGDAPAPAAGHAS